MVLIFPPVTSRFAPRNAKRYLREGEVVGAQILLAERHLDLLFRKTGELHLADALGGTQVLLARVGRWSSMRGRSSPSPLNAKLTAGRMFSSLNVRIGSMPSGKGRNPVHGILHVLQHQVRIEALDHFDGDDAAVLLAHAADPFDRR